MRDSWTCLSVTKGPGILSDAVRRTLKLAACDLYLNKWDEMRLENNLVSGVIRTKWTTHNVGGRSGVLFRAHIDCVDGTDYQVNFLFSEEDLERGVELVKAIQQEREISIVTTQEFPEAELYRFEDLRGPSRKVH